jgi:hypothetical protein
VNDSANALLWGQSKVVLVLAAVYLSIYALMYFSARRIGKLTATDSQSELERGVVSPWQDIASTRPLPRGSAPGRIVFRTDSQCCFDQCWVFQCGIFPGFEYVTKYIEFWLRFIGVRNSLPSFFCNDWVTALLELAP